MKQFKSIALLFAFLTVIGLAAEEAAVTEPKKEETSHKEEKLKITGRVQFRGMAGEKESVFSNGHRDYNTVDWNFRRVRFGAIYEGKYWGTVVDIKAENLLNKPYTTTTTAKDPVSGQTYVTKVSTKDNRGAIQEANLWLNMPFLKSRLTMGQLKVPFMREQLASSARLNFTERSMMSQAMTQWEIGLKYDFHPLVLINKNLEHYMTVDLSLTNGHGSSAEGVGRQEVLLDTRSGTQPLLTSPLYGWRVEINPFGGLMKDGKMGAWKEGDEIFQKDTKLSLGVAGVSINQLYISGQHNSYTTNAPHQDLLNVQTTAENGTIYDPKTKTGGYVAQADQTTPGRPNLGLVGRTYDFTFVSHGLYLNGSYTQYRGSASNGLAGYQGTLGYIVPIKSIHLMPVVRYDYMKGDFNHNGQVNEEEIFKNYWVGLNIYAKKHDLKFQIMYQIQNDRLGIDPQTNRASDMRNNVVYFQAQSNFSVGVKTE